MNGRMASPSILFIKQNLKPDENKAMYIDNVLILVPVHCVYQSLERFSITYGRTLSLIYASASGKIVNMCPIALIIGTAFYVAEVKSNH